MLSVVRDRRRLIESPSNCWNASGNWKARRSTDLREAQRTFEIHGHVCMVAPPRMPSGMVAGTIAVLNNTPPIESGLRHSLKQGT